MTIYDAGLILMVAVLTVLNFNTARRAEKNRKALEFFLDHMVKVDNLKLKFDQAPEDVRDLVK